MPSSTLSLKEGESLRAAETHDANPPERSVPCVDDKKDVLAVLAEVLQNSGYGTLSAASGSEGLHLLRSTTAHVVVLDYEMPEMNGDLIAQAIRRFKPGVPIVLFTGVPDDVPDRVRQNVNHVVHKTDFSGLLSAVKKLSEESASKRNPT
jgi:CheY-like chemotaxis protein